VSQATSYTAIVTGGHHAAKASKKKMLRGISTKFAAANKQEIEFGLSCLATVTGGQQQKLQ
jgi:hypothetical protein